MLSKTKSILNYFLNILLLILLLTMGLLFIAFKASEGEPEIMGYQFRAVLSGSMEPTFNTGSIIALQPVEDPASLKENDVITFIQEDKSLITHRIVQVILNGEHTMFQTKGDNNEVVDGQYVLAANVVGKYTGLTIPYLGYFVEFTKSGKGTAIMLIIPGVLLLIYSAINIISGLRELEKTNTNRSEVNNTVESTVESG